MRESGKHMNRVDMNRNHSLYLTPVSQSCAPEETRGDTHYDIGLTAGGIIPISSPLCPVNNHSSRLSFWYSSDGQ